MVRALKEFRIRGIKTNIPYLINVLQNKQFISGSVDTSFIDENPDLFTFKSTQNRAQKLLNYLGHVMVNGPTTELGTNLPPANVEPTVPELLSVANDGTYNQPKGWRDVYLKKGAQEFAKSIRESTKSTNKLLLMDTTMRDAHQSLLATRVRSYDMKRIAPFVSNQMSDLFAMEM